MQRGRALRVVAVAMLAATAGPLTGTAWADKPELVTGQFRALAPPVPIAPPEVTGKATHLLLANRALTSGDDIFTPRGADPSRTVYRCVTVEGKAKFHCRGEGEGTVTVAGVGTGEVTSRLNFTCTSISPTAALCAGRIRLDGVKGGDLAGVHATGTFENIGVDGRSDYRLRLHRH